MSNEIKPGDPLVAKWLGYEPQGVIFDEANEISEYVWRKLADKYSHSMMRDQIQRGAWPPDLVRYAVADNAPKARRMALFAWKDRFSSSTGWCASGLRGWQELTYGRRQDAIAIAWRANLGLAATGFAGRRLPQYSVFKVYLGTFRGQRFAVSELVE